MGDFNNEKYPVSSLKPKAETGVLSFLGKYPNFNGSDVTIAVLDSGVDPNAAGLQVSYARKKTVFISINKKIPDTSRWYTQSRRTVRLLGMRRHQHVNGCVRNI